jgi:MYXO-CTERM domain-containing protein
MAVVVTLSLSITSTQAAELWRGDFETGDLDQWNFQLNAQNISVVSMPLVEGMYAAEIQLTNDATWPNGLKRVELQHAPGAVRTAEGADTYFAWSFYLPATLPTDPSQQIGYWESGQSYQQMMAFTVTGESIRFVTRQPSNQTHWQADNMVTAQQWHRIAMHIHWSKDENVGEVNVWFDGTQVVTAAGARTLNDDNPHFTQVGLLRGQVDFTDAPIIVIDDAVEGESLMDVRPDPQGAGGSGGTAGVGGGGVGGSGTSSGTGGAGQGGGATSSGGTATQPLSDEESDCGCTMPGGSPGSSGFALLALLGLAASMRRRGA